MKLRRSLYARPEIVRGQQSHRRCPSLPLGGRAERRFRQHWLRTRRGRGLARDLPETALHVTSRRPRLSSSEAPFTCAIVRRRGVTHGVVSPGRHSGPIGPPTPPLSRPLPSREYPDAAARPLGRSKRGPKPPLFPRFVARCVWRSEWVNAPAGTIEPAAAPVPHLGVRLVRLSVRMEPAGGRATRPRVQGLP
jgi:hypothetical protein